MERGLGHLAPAIFRRRRTTGDGRAAFLADGLCNPSRMTFHLSRVSKRLFESLIGTGFESLFWFDGAPQRGTNFRSLPFARAFLLKISICKMSQIGTASQRANVNPLCLSPISLIIR